MEGMLGEIRLFAANFAPVNWAFCNGSLLQISEYPALYMVLGTTYGGNAVSTFALPDFRGRAPIHATTQSLLGVQAPLGTTLGSESHTLTINELPFHSHQATVHLTGDVAVSSLDGDSNSPAGNYPAVASDTPDLMYGPPASGAFSALGTATLEIQTQIGIAGSSQPHENRMPSVAIHFIICIQGIYPSQP